MDVFVTVVETGEGNEKEQDRVFRRWSLEGDSDDEARDKTVVAPELGFTAEGRTAEGKRKRGPFDARVLVGEARIGGGIRL